MVLEKGTRLVFGLMDGPGREPANHTSVVYIKLIRGKASIL